MTSLGNSVGVVDVLFDTDEAGETTAVQGTHDFARFTLLPAVENCIGISVIYANVPFTYYVFDATNNQFKISDAANPTGVTITITPGTYNSVSLATQIISQIAASLLTNKAHFIAFVDSTTSKLRIYDNKSPSATFTVDFNVANSAYKTLGFAKTSYVSTDATFKDDSDADVTGKYSIEGPRVVNLTGPAQMFLASDDLGSSIYGKVRNQTSLTGILGFWPVNANYQGTIEFQQENPEMKKMSKTTISQLSFKLGLGNRTQYHDGTNTVSYLPLNGESFQVGLRFHVLDSEQLNVQDTAGRDSFDPRTIPVGRVLAKKRKM